MTGSYPDKTSLSSLQRIVHALQQCGGFDHPVTAPEVIETHISIVLLTGDYAYKFKKPVDLGFVDFTTLEKRRYFCEEELRLNRRLAPELYLEVVAIGGDADHPVAGVEPAIEYCVKMRQFPRAAELDRVVAKNGVPPAALADLANEVAAFHATAAVAGPDSPYGAPAQVRRDCMDNFDAIEAGLPVPDRQADLATLRRWTEGQLQTLMPVIADRHGNGYVRECHGDMHLTNMVWLDECIRVFDCIEFNAALRWIDVMNEIAFLLMDLDARGHADLGRVFLNAYLEAGGDYHGLALLPLFKVYRSMVRAKVARLRAGQTDTPTGFAQARDRFERHVRLALRYIEPPPPPALIITHGLSGSGKTTLTSALIPCVDAVRIRSDVERKRLQGLVAGARSNSSLGQGLYAADQTQRTYLHLEDTARAILAVGLPVIVDATFLKHEQRQRFQCLAQETGCRFVILACMAAETVLRERVQTRSRQGSDASEADIAVLEQQLETVEPLTAAEQSFAVSVDTVAGMDSRILALRLGLEPAP